MKTKFHLVIFFLTFLFSFPQTHHAYWVWSPESGKFVNPENAVEDTADEQYDFALKLYRQKNLEEAADQLKKLLKKFPGARISAEAQYRLGTICEEKGDYMKAFHAYKTLVESYPQSERIAEVIEREFRIGNLFLSGKKGKMMGLEILPSQPRAVEIFKHITEQSPYSEFGDQAQFHLGLAYQKGGRYDEAAQSFQALIDKYPQSELVPQARFQLAESSFMRSRMQYRDQRALDEASKQVDRFLERFPGDAEAQEKAAKLRQVIDEKNAEKNYRIGAYYEKEKYISSALIYYTDVAARYPNTRWGTKASEKLAKFGVPAGTPSSKAESAQAVNEKEKKKIIKAREEDVKRRQREIKSKFKTLREKQKELKKNPSEDFKRVLDRWQASLEEEQAKIGRDRVSVAESRREFGMRPSGSFLGVLPSLSQPLTEIEKIRRIEAKKLYHVSDEKQKILESKEELYKTHGEISSRLKGLEGYDISEAVRTAQSAPGVTVVMKEAPSPKVHTGEGSWVAKSAPLEALLEKQMHLREKIAAQDSLIQTLTQAFDNELALAEQKRLLEELGAKEDKKEDPRTLRRDVKTKEKEIRKRYEEIEDRHKHKNEMLEALDRLLKKKEAEDSAITKVGRAATAPAKGFVGFLRSFIFGLPSREVELTQSAEKIRFNPEDSAEARKLKEEVEFESLLIEAKIREIANLEKELEILKAKASLAGGYKFRSSLVKVPYDLMTEAVDSARKMVPKKNRQEILVNRLSRETEKLEKLKSDEKIIKQEKSLAPFETKAKLSSEGSKNDRGKLQKELDDIEERLNETIQKESELEIAETSILEKRVQFIDRAITRTSSQALSQDLLVEKQRLEERISELSTRRNFLTKERERFSAPRPQAARS